MSVHVLPQLDPKSPLYVEPFKVSQEAIHLAYGTLAIIMQDEPEHAAMAWVAQLLLAYFQALEEQVRSLGASEASHV
jgi:hypothetical protein